MINIHEMLEYWLAGLVRISFLLLKEIIIKLGLSIVFEYDMGVTDVEKVIPPESAKMDDWPSRPISAKHKVRQPNHHRRAFV